jgi:hypothetical protein
LPQFEFESEKFLWLYLCYLSWLENRVCLSRGVQVTGVTWRVVMRIVAGVEDLVQRTGDGQALVGYLVAGRSRGRVTLCAVCTMHKETRSTGFLVEPQNQGQRFVSGLASKPLGRIFNGLASKPLGWFPSLGLKTAATVLRFEPQNHHDDFLVWASKPSMQLWFVDCTTKLTEVEDGVGHASISSGFLCLDASQARVIQSSLKTGGGAVQILHVALSRRLR